MAIGLEITNSDGKILIDENSLALRFIRKETTTGAPTLAPNEVAAIKKPNWGLNTSKTFYIFEYSVKPSNFGLEISRADGSVTMAIAEGYARVIAAHRYRLHPNENLNFTGNPVGNYAVIHPGLVAIEVPHGSFYSAFYVEYEDFITTSKGFVTKWDRSTTLGDGNATADTSKLKTVLIIDVAGL